MLKRWLSFTRFLNDGLVCLTNNAAERSIALGRKALWLTGSGGGGERTAAIYTLIVTALCRARHKAVYAGRRTMPNASECLAHRRRYPRPTRRGLPQVLGIVWQVTGCSGIQAGGRTPQFIITQTPRAHGKSV